MVVKEKLVGRDAMVAKVVAVIRTDDPVPKEWNAMASHNKNAHRRQHEWRRYFATDTI